MTTMIAEVYDALIEAGASEEKARRAAEAIASYDDRFNRLDLAIADLKGSGDLAIADFKRSTDLALADLKSSIRLIQWQLAAVWIVGAPSVWLMLRIAAKVGALG